MQAFRISIIGNTHRDATIHHRDALSHGEAFRILCADLGEVPADAFATVWAKMAGKVLIWRKRPHEDWAAPGEARAWWSR